MTAALRIPTYLITGPVNRGKATIPLRLPKKAPPCYDSQRLWDLYRATANYSAGDGFTFCTDCLPSHKAAMQEQGRCKYPATTFVVATGVIVGRRKGRTIQ